MTVKAFREMSQCLRHDKSTGRLFWIKRRGQRGQIGAEAGYINGKGYRLIGFCGRQYLAHWVVFFFMAGRLPKEIDHINGVRDDNRWENLREVTRADNCRNAARPRNNTSGCVGVTWENRRQMWTAKIKVNYKNKYLGDYLNFFDAVAARKSAENKYNFHPNHGRKT